MSHVGNFKGWREMLAEPAPLGQMVWLWSGGWRHAFPGQRIGDLGKCRVDTCEIEAKGWDTFAEFWMPMPQNPR